MLFVFMKSQHSAGSNKTADKGNTSIKRRYFYGGKIQVSLG